jgi:Flp pilus assembly protein TadG
MVKSFASTLRRQLLDRSAVMQTVAYSRDVRGGVAPLLAICALPLFGAVGASLDYARASAARSAMQSAADAAALALVRSEVSSEAAQLEAAAKTYFDANFARRDVQDLAISSSAVRENGGTTLALSASGSVKTQFFGVLGVTQLAVTARSTVTTLIQGSGCVLALNKTAPDAIKAQGNAAVKMTG